MNFLNVSILNGGIDRWRLENKKVTKLPVKYPERNFKSKNQSGFFCEKEENIKILKIIKYI